MANNRLYIKCKSCGEELCIGKHFGHCYFTPSDDTDKRLNDFYKKHAFCQKDQDGFADRGDFEITYEIEPMYRAERESVQGGDAEMDNCQVQAPQNYMQQSRHNDGTDLISRADAIEAVASITMSIHLSDVICDKLLALPSADTEPKRVLQGYCKGANTIQTIRHEELKQIANTRKAVESADAVQGEWIWRTDIPIGDGRTSAGYICSNCGKDYWHGNMLKYCPSCGARMYKGGDDE